MAVKKKAAPTRPGPDELVEGQVWWSSGKPGIVSDKHYVSSIQIHGVEGTWSRLSISIMGDSCGILGVKTAHVIAFRDHLLKMKRV